MTGTNSKLDILIDALTTDREFDGFDISEVNPNADIKIAESETFLDTLTDNFTSIQEDATAIFTDYETIVTMVDDDFSAPTLTSSTCSLTFEFFGSTYTPIATLSNIISPYSAVFSLLTYIAIMYMNFKMLFIYFALGRN